MSSSGLKAIPDKATIAKAAAIKVFDKNGKEVTFGSIIADQRTLVVFIRHFFCGRCQGYICELSEVPPETFTKAGLKLVVIGCGGWQPIDKFIELTGYHGEIYGTGSNYELYDTLQMVNISGSTPAGETPRQYVQNSGLGYLGVAMLSIKQAFTYFDPRHIPTAGRTSQQGGEFVFGPGEKCDFASRMRHSEDHIDVDKLIPLVTSQSGLDLHVADARAEARSRRALVGSEAQPGHAPKSGLVGLRAGSVSILIGVMLAIWWRS